jgi:acyl-CoA synthetase (AMP-forming)/AMP-acid ligase II
MSFTSPFPDVDIPDVGVYDYLFGSIDAADLDRVAMVEARSGTQTSYREMIAGINVFAAAMAGRGIGVADVVGLLAPNSSTFAIAYHGILRAGATATTISALSTPTDIAKQLTDARARMLITVRQLAEPAQKAAAAAGLPDDQLIVLDANGFGNNTTASGIPHISFDPATHLAALPYSSGTTGNPKGVMLTHRNLVANIAQIRPMPGITAGDAIIAVLPFFHAYGLTVLLGTLLDARCRLIIMPTFDLTEFLANIEKYRCAAVFIVPPIAVALAKHPMVDSYDMSSLRTVLCGAAPLDEGLGHAVAARLGCQVVQGYGMTEMSGGGCVPFDGGPPSALGIAAPLGSCGWPLPNSVTKIVDPETCTEIDVPDQGRSAAGELWVKGPHVMAGYLGNEQATADIIDADGFLHTGDLASVDADGCVYIVDRLKELIKYKGYQVAPAELEALLLTHPSIVDVGVVGISDTESGEIPKAFVVTLPGTDLTDADVMKFVAERSAPYKKIRRVEFIDAVPKSASGKILRKVLKARGSASA